MEGPDRVLAAPGNQIVELRQDKRTANGFIERTFSRPIDLVKVSARLTDQRMCTVRSIWVF